MDPELRDKASSILQRQIEGDIDKFNEAWSQIFGFEDTGWNFLDYQIPVLLGVVFHIGEPLRYSDKDVMQRLPRNEYVLYLMTTEKLPELTYYKLYYGPPSPHLHLVVVGYKYLNLESAIPRLGPGFGLPVYISRFTVDLIQGADK